MARGRLILRDLATSAWLLWSIALVAGALLAPSAASAKSCFVGCSSTEYCALDLTCQPRGSANQSCSGLGQGTCRSGLVCDFAAGKCRHDPPTAGETCNSLVSCASAYYCSAAVGGTCVTRRVAGQSCSGLGQGTCQSGLVCDISGVCRHNPPTQSEPCGVGVSCAAGLACSSLVAGTCQAPKQVGQACVGIGQGNCVSGLVCDVSGESRHDPPESGEPCGTGVSCKSGLACSALVAGVCIAPRMAGQSCVGVGQGNCDSSLVCDFSGVCRHQPPEDGEPCGLGVDCAAGLLCNAEVGGTCTTPRAAGEPCGGIGQGNCQSGLVCDVSGVCRHQPPELGEPCGVGVSCSADLVCTAVVGGVCSEQRLAGQSCVGVGQGNCASNLVCDFSGVCRHQPPEEGEPCGLGVDCAAGLLCNAQVGGTCTTPRAAGETCGGVGQGNCQSGLVCDVSGVCRHQPPELGEPCGVGVACAGDLVCNAVIGGSCTAPGTPGASCIGLGQGSCNSGLVCDVSGKCRHQPPEDGEPCGTGVSCADDLVCTALIGGSCSPRRTAGQSCLGIGQGTCDSGLVCDVSGKCRHQPPENGEPCGVGVACAGDLVCTALVGGTCSPRRTVGQSCLGVGQGSCDTGLACDAFSGVCRHDPPLLGEACSVFAACVDDLVCVQSQCREPGASGAPCSLLDPDSCQGGRGLVCDLGTSTCRHNPPLAGEACGGLIQCASDLTCLAQRCVAQGEADDPCDPTVGTSCKLGLVCDLGRFVCRHDPSQLGEACIGLGRGSCDTGLVCDLSGECRHSPPRRGEPCGQFVNCATGLACNALVGGRCGTPRKVGESCIGIGRANCEEGAICRFFAESGTLGLKCFPEGNGPIPAALCRRFYAPALSSITAGVGGTQTFGAAGGGGAGVAATAEAGVAYGQDGEYGCYFTNCIGALTDAAVGAGVCASTYGSYGDVAGNSSAVVETITPIEPLNLSAGQVFTPFGSPPAQPIGVSGCVSIGAGVLPFDVGVYECHTQVTDIDLDRSGEGFFDSVLTALNLDPGAPGGDTDRDGVADVAEIGGDTGEPLDSDADGVIDALESGDAATSARVASGVPLPGGGSVTIATQQGELLSAVGAAPADGSPPPDVDFPLGAISYMTTAPVGGSVVVQLAFSQDLPASPMPFKLDHSGAYAPLSPALWTQLDARTLAFTLTDGASESDLDGLADGIVDDPIAIGTPSVEPNVSPVVHAGADEIIAAGDAFVGGGFFFDPDDGDSWSAVVDYGDGSGPQALALGADQSFPLSHVFGAPGSYVVTVVVSDSQNASGADLLTVNVEAVGVAEQTIFDLAARAKSGKVDITWTPVLGADSYNVYRGAAQGGPFELIASAHPSGYAVYADSGLRDGQQYCYAVISLAGGVESLPSNVACATPPASRPRGR